MLENWKLTLIKALDDLKPIAKPFLSDPLMLLLLLIAGGLILIGLVLLVMRRSPGANFPYATEDPVSSMSRVVRLESALHAIQVKLNSLTDAQREKIDEVKDCMAEMRAAFKLLDKFCHSAVGAIPDQLEQLAQEIVDMRIALDGTVRLLMEMGMVRSAAREETSTAPIAETIEKTADSTAPDMPQKIAYSADLLSSRLAANENTRRGS